MYKLIIADDEEIERRAFRLMINRSFDNVAVLEDAVNGIDLINKAAELKPDIAIVDINMPGINGLEAIKRIKQTNSGIRIILHTAYSQFEYAQEAIALGADSYVLKPAKREKIKAAITDCILKIDLEKNQEDKQKRLEEIVNEIAPIMENDFMSSIQLGEINPENAARYLELLNMKFSSAYIMTMILTEDDPMLIKKDAIEKSALKKELLSFVHQEMKNICSCLVSSIVGNRISVFISIEEVMPLYNTRVWSIEMAELMADKVRERFQLKMSIGIGQAYNALEQIPTSYKESINALMDPSLRSRVKHFGELMGGNSFNSPIAQYENELIRSIMSNDSYELQTLLAKVFEELAETENLQMVKDVILGFAARIQSALAENKLYDIELFSLIRISNELNKLTGRVEIQSWISGLLKKTMNQLHNFRRDKINGFVQEGIEYIKLHFQEDISLEKTAEAINISPYYLSRLFKQELNINFVDYLTEVRMNEAIRLLRKSSLSTKELADRTGYVNPTYFCKVFKRFTGKTIGEFRKEMLGC